MAGFLVQIFFSRVEGELLDDLFTAGRKLGTGEVGVLAGQELVHDGDGGATEGPLQTGIFDIEGFAQEFEVLGGLLIDVGTVDVAAFRG